MEIIVAIAIGVLTGSGVWLLLRPRTFQVIIGLSLLSYAVNLFIFSTGGLRIGAAPILERGMAGSLAQHADPLPQALVLTAIFVPETKSATMRSVDPVGQLLAVVTLFGVVYTLIEGPVLVTAAGATACACPSASTSTT